MSDLIIAALLAITLGLCVWAIRSCWYIRHVYATSSHNDELRRQYWFAMGVGIIAIIVGAVSCWSLVRFAFPEFSLGGLPAPFTTLIIIVSVNALLLVPITLARTWARWRREGRIDGGHDE